jgi:hypothetical protein
MSGLTGQIVVGAVALPASKAGRLVVGHGGVAQAAQLLERVLVEVEIADEHDNEEAAEGGLHRRGAFSKWGRPPHRRATIQMTCTRPGM